MYDLRPHFRLPSSEIQVKRKPFSYKKKNFQKQTTATKNIYQNVNYSRTKCSCKVKTMAGLEQNVVLSHTEWLADIDKMWHTIFSQERNWCKGIVRSPLSVRAKASQRAADSLCESEWRKRMGARPGALYARFDTYICTRKGKMHILQVRS